jgi:CRP-like cAMP-binding protein
VLLACDSRAPSASCVIQVGYGDITPTNNLERTYSLFALLLGALVFGYMLSTIGSLVSAIDKQAALSEEKMDEIKEYMRWRRLPRDLVIRMRRYYTYYYSRKTAFDEDSILRGLTPGLRLEVVKHSLKETIGRIPLFANTLQPEFQLEVFPLFRPVSAAPREIIFAKGDPADGLLFLLKGGAEVISGYDGRVLYRVRQGQHFGEEVLTGKRRVATHRAAVSCEMFQISVEDLSELFRRRPAEGKVIHAAVLREHMRKERLRVLSLRLLRNKLVGSHPKHVAALTVQMAWSKYLDRLHNPSSLEVDLEAAEASLTESWKSMTPAATLLPDPPSSPGGFSAVGGQSLERRLEKLDRIDHLVAKVEQLIDKVDKYTPPRSGGIRK